MILSKETVEEMFKYDMTFAANQVVDPKDLRWTFLSFEYALSKI